MHARDKQNQNSNEYVYKGGVFRIFSRGGGGGADFQKTSKNKILSTFFIRSIILISELY